MCVYIRILSNFELWSSKLDSQDVYMYIQICLHVTIFLRHTLYIYIYAHPAHDPRFSVASVDHGGGGG